MSERSSVSARHGVALGYLTVLAGCATALSGTLPADELAGGAGGNSASAGSPAGGSSLGGASPVAGSSSSAGSYAAGAGSTAGKSNASAGAGGSAGKASGSGGSAGKSAGAGGATNGGSSGAAGAGMQLFSDDFESGTVDGWVPAGGMWAVASDGSKVYAQQATGTASMILLSSNGSPSWTDQRVEARVKVLAFGGQSSSYVAAICARYSAAGYYSLALRYDGKIAIRKGSSNIGSANAGITAGTWYTLRLDVIGSTLNAYVDGVLKETETDSTLTAGGIAVSAVNTTAVFDDVKVSLP